MSAEFPEILRNCFKNAAYRFGKDLEALDWPSAHKNAPCTEANATLNIAICLSNAQVPFHLYAEAAASAGQGGGRIDLVGCNGDIAFALEAKRSGDIGKQADSILCDVKRLRGFKPSLAEVAQGKKNDWWRNATSRWGIVVVVSFENEGNGKAKDVDAAWCAKNEAELCKKMGYPTSGTDPFKQKAFVLLDRELRDANAIREIAPITDGVRWVDCAKGRLLWAAFPLAA